MCQAGENIFMNQVLSLCFEITIVGRVISGFVMAKWGTLLPLSPCRIRPNTGALPKMIV